MKKIFFLLTFALPMINFAQPGMPNNPTPINGVIGLLFAAGASYGISEYVRRQREKKG